MADKKENTKTLAQNKKATAPLKGRLKSLSLRRGGTK